MEDRAPLQRTKSRRLLWLVAGLIVICLCVAALALVAGQFVVNWLSIDSSTISGPGGTPVEGSSTAVPVGGTPQPALRVNGALP
jgi:hypothetical protein